jgi:hypothetical protein
MRYRVTVTHRAHALEIGVQVVLSQTAELFSSRGRTSLFQSENMSSKLIKSSFFCSLVVERIAVNYKVIGSTPIKREWFLGI